MSKKTTSDNLIADLSAAEYELASLADSMCGRATAEAALDWLADAARAAQLCRWCCPEAALGMTSAAKWLAIAVGDAAEGDEPSFGRMASHAQEAVTRALGLVCLALHRACAKPAEGSGTEAIDALDGIPAVDESDMAALDALADDEDGAALDEELDRALDEELDRALDEALDDEFDGLPDIGILYGEGEQDA